MGWLPRDSLSNQRGEGSRAAPRGRVRREAGSRPPWALRGLTLPGPAQGTLVNTLREIKPTVFLGMPRIWEKMLDMIKENLANSSNLRKKAFSWAKSTGLRVNTKRMLG